MVQQCLGLHAGDTGAFGPKGHQRHRHPCRKAGIAVGLGVANQQAAGRIPRDAGNRLKQRRRMGFAHRQRISTDKRTKVMPNAKTLDQCFGQPCRLVGANCQGKASIPQGIKGFFNAGIKRGMDVDRICIRG